MKISKECEASTIVPPSTWNFQTNDKWKGAQNLKVLWDDAKMGSAGGRASWWNDRRKKNNALFVM